MNDGDEGSRLPELSNEDVELLYNICKTARESNDPLFRALFAAFENVKDERQLDNERECVLYSYVMRVGEVATKAKREGRSADVVEQLKNVLGGVNITILENQSNVDDEEQTEALSEPSPQKKPRNIEKRRVSFDDANFEETWLSEHSLHVNPPTPAAPQALLSLPARSRKNAAAASPRRARSTSSQRQFDLPIRQAAPKSSQRNFPPADDSSEMSEHGHDQLNPTLYFEPSQTQLEQNAEAFLSTSALRATRQALHAWHDHAIRLQAMRSQAYDTATAQDHRTLLKQSFDILRNTLRIRIVEHRKSAEIKRLDRRTTDLRNEFLKYKVFTHWATMCSDETVRRKAAQHYMLRVTYFRRWRKIASENQAKVRRILVRKYIAVWREKTARRLLWEQQAEAHYEERLMKRCKSAWFWQFCSQRVEGWHEQWVEKKGFRRLVGSWQACQARERQAQEFHDSHLARKALRTLRMQLQSRREDETLVQRHRERALARKSLSTLHAQAKLQPIARAVKAKVNDNMKRKILTIWRHDLALNRQATEVDRNRILQNAWTNWNDSLRCKALAQKIDERVLMENLYRWILRERLSLFQRTAHGRLVGRALRWWHSKVAVERDQLADAEVVFKERQRRRTLALGMRKLNIATRAREDADRAALEFANSRAMPKVLDAWKEQTSHTRELAKWAADARFYCLCSRTLKVWKERTSEHKANRRRDAYIQVRARVKIRLASKCFTKLRTTCTEIRSMTDEADRRAQTRVADTATKAFTTWRRHAARYTQLDFQAQELDQQKLLSAALAALNLKLANLAGKDQSAQQFHHETDLAVLAGALRRLQWATFTASRKVESAEALWARNRDHHVKQMLRHWAQQTAARRTAAADTVEVTEVQEEPESPSLRPASRAASRSAFADAAMPSSPPTQVTQVTQVTSALGATPSYLRTPSRPRRAGRFRPIPTPAPFTPMAFDSAFLATTPAPLEANQLPGEGEQGGQGSEGLTPQITPFSRKLRASGFPSGASAGAGSTVAPPSALRSSAFRRSTVQSGTGKSVRFARGRFSGSSSSI